ncbi:hypothetical protein HDU96_010357 [Phlyctochytrium bullatum]|nr:hypothetical protein HDU96_010357 [Phlyctochytrium bullatum]
MKVAAVLAVATGLLAVASAAVDPKASVPTVGQYVRFRSLPRGSNLALSPVDGAEFIAGQRFDISVELHSEDLSVTPSLTDLEFTINGVNAGQFLNASAPYVDSYQASYTKNAKDRDSGISAKFNVARLNWRDLALPKSGSYEISLKVGAEEVKATWVVKGSSTRKAKNVLLFIGDGTAPAAISAARYLAKETKFGKFDLGGGFLTMEKFDNMGKIATNGIDSMLTDSANSAAAYNNGQKTYVNALNVYADTSANTFDDTKVETLASIIRRTRPNMCIGVVTTAAVYDATPAAVYSYTRSRNDYDFIVDQNLNGPSKIDRSAASSGKPFTASKENFAWSAPGVKVDVMLGGGGNAYCGIANCTSILTSTGGRTDQYAAHAAAGYKVFLNGTSLKSYSGSDRVLGIFQASHMNVWEDRVVSTGNLAKAVGPENYSGTAKDQPGLKDMTLKAIEIMEKRCSDGWFLMSEAASVDKQMHPVDYDRALADLLELDDTLKAVKDLGNKDTQIYLTADHAQGFDVYGSVDMDYMRAASNDDSKDIRGAANATPLQNPSLKTEKRQAVGVYQEAGWVDTVIDPATGMPTKFAGQRFKLAAGKIDSPGYVEDFEHKATARVPTKAFTYSFQDADHPTVINRTTYVSNPSDVTATGGIAINGNLPENEGSTVHTLQAVDLYCYGPVSHKCAKVMDNTELFFLMADALGLGDVPEVPTLPPVTNTTTTTVPLPSTTTVVLTTTASTCNAATITAPAATVTVTAPVQTVTVGADTTVTVTAAQTTLTVTASVAGVCSTSKPVVDGYGDNAVSTVKPVVPASSAVYGSSPAPVATSTAATAGYASVPSVPKTTSIPAAAATKAGNGNMVYNAAASVSASALLGAAGVIAAVFAMF